MKICTLFISLILLPFISFSQAIDNSWLIYSSEPLNIEQYTKSNEQSIRCIFKAPYIYALNTKKQTDIKEIRKALDLDDSIVIFPDAKLEKRISPNDPRFSEQWNLEQIGLEEVWSETVGQTPENRDPIVIAVLDDGYDIEHQDLRDNWWINEAEIPGDNIDNDNNSYVDDHMGFNTRLLNDEHPKLPHGTQVAGIIGAKGDNGIGIAGVTWETKMLAISDVDSFGKLLVGMDYIYEMKKLYLDSNGERGCNIVVNNFSGGIRNRFPVDFPGWCEAYDKLGEVGILSVTAVANEDLDPEADGDMPTLCNSDFLVTVTNTGRGDLKARDAAESRTSVDIGAPGDNIITTDPNNTYLSLPGTSASSPHVAGAIGLIYSLDCTMLQDLIDNNPEQAAREVKTAILENVDLNSSLDQTVSGGRLNVLKAVTSLTELCGTIVLGDLKLGYAMNSSLAFEPTSFWYETDTFGKHDFYIHDFAGRLLYHKAIFPTVFGGKTINIDGELEIETSGIYFATLINESDHSSVKFSVIKN